MATSKSNDQFNKLKQHAEDNGFELLETEWLGSGVKHRFRHKGTGKEYEGIPNKLMYRGFPKDLRTDLERFNELKQLAEDNGFELLESKWLGGGSKHRFLHKESGKEYEGTPGNVLRQGFPKDLRTDHDRINELRQFAEDNGFELLETEWLGAFKNHRFIHKESGKEYEWTPNNILRVGFPKDLRTDLDRFNELKQFAEDNGFELLETEWFGSSSKHRFIHKESGKEYEWIPNQVMRVGFPKDLRTDLDRFNELKQFAEDNGFELLETEWLGVLKKHRFIHKESGKEYEWIPGNILRKGFPRDLRTDLNRFNELRQFAEDNGFELLETEWLGIGAKHRFRHMETGKEYEWFGSQIRQHGFPKYPSKLATENARAARLNAQMPPYPDDEIMIDPPPSPSSPAPIADRNQDAGEQASDAPIEQEPQVERPRMRA